MSADAADAPRPFGAQPPARSDELEPSVGAPDGADLLGADEEGGDLDDLEAELTAEVIPTTTLEVDGRPRYTVDYRIDLTGKMLDGFRKKARDRSFVDGLDGVKFAAIGLATLCTRINRDGKPLEIDGELATFQSRNFLDLIGATTAVDGVKKFYGLEGKVDAAMRKVMSDAGWGDDAATADPT